MCSGCDWILGGKKTLLMGASGDWDAATIDFMDKDRRLAVYGTLAPGRVNHHQLSGMAGTWERGTVKGHLFESGWGAAMGFPGLILDPLGVAVDVHIFESADLPEHWARLDEFEGSGYRRAATKVKTAAGERSAWIYVLADERRP